MEQAVTQWIAKEGLSPITENKAHRFGDQAVVGRKIKNHAEVRPNQPALVASGYAPFSYRELQVLVAEFRKDLRQAGLSRNARIAVALPSGPQAALAIVAVACSAVAIPINPNLTLSEIEKSFSALEIDAVILFRDGTSAARTIAEQKCFNIIDAIPANEGRLGLKLAGLKNSGAASLDEPDPSAPAFILQTSGTTADAKLIPFSHENMLAAAARLQSWFKLTPEDRCLSVSPLYYSHGLKVTVFTPLLTGGTIAFPADFTKYDYSEWFGVLKPTWYSAGPTLHHLILDQTRFKAEAKNQHSLRFILSGGAPLSRDVLIGVQNTFGVPVVEHYGSSEAAQISANLPPPGPYKLGTCGIPLPDTIIIVADDGSHLSPGEQGEIFVGGPTVISGYLNDPELNRLCFVDGWFKSGDIGSIDADGFLTLHGRKNDLINRGGEKISPAEIDDVLMRHPAVAEAAAFAVPHSRLGQDVAAAVVLRSGMTTTPVELRRYLQGQIASFKIPRRIVIQDKLPKGTTGKVLRRRLTESMTGAAAEATTIETPPATKNTSLDSTVLTKLWERLLKVAPLSPDDNFFEKGGDSLLAVEMLTELEWLTGQPIPASILFEAATARELALKLSEQGDIRVRSLIPMHSTGSRVPLFFFHGDYKGGYYAAELASLLGSDQPLMIVAPHGIGEEAIPPSIEAMAADRLPLILSAQPQGPYRLCGNCLGGIVAFEVARMLVAAGKQVELVAMIDPPTINARRSVQLLFSAMGHALPTGNPVVDRAKAWTWFKGATLQRVLNMPMTQRWAWAKEKVQRLVARRKDQVRTAANVVVQSDADQPEMTRVDVTLFRLFADERVSKYALAMSNYFPRPLDVRVIYFSTEHGVGKWRRLSHDLEEIKLPGNHYDYDLENLADHLNARLLTLA